jgi:hypothetical protein
VTTKRQGLSVLDNVALGRLYGRKSARSRRAPEAEAMEVLALVGLAAEAARSASTPRSRSAVAPQICS